MAKVLDSLKLNMQRHKKIYTRQEFQIKCENMINDNPINSLEMEMIEIISNYSPDPYANAGIFNISEAEREVFSEERINQILMGYLTGNKDYQRIRWLFRRLSNVGVDTAVNLVVREIDNLMPVISDVALYFSSIAEKSENVLCETGEQLLNFLENQIVCSNDFFQLTILNLFANTSKFNNISKLVGMYSKAAEHMKRELILAGYAAGQKAWIRELKQDYSVLGLWAQRALLISSDLLPKDERKFFVQNVTKNSNNLAAQIIAKNIKKKT